MQHFSSFTSAVRSLTWGGLLVLGTAGGYQARAQGTVTVTTGAAAPAGYHPGPIYRSSAASSYWFSRYAYVFDATELAAAGLRNGDQITGISWEKTTAVTSSRSGLFRVLIKNSALTTYTAAAPWATLTTGTTQAYNNTTFTVPAAIGPVPFAFTAPFAYTGQSLEVFTDWEMVGTGTGNASSGAYSWAQNTVVDKILGYCNFAAITANLSPTDNSIGTLDNLRPLTTFSITRVTGTRAQVLLSGGAYPNPTSGRLHLALSPRFAGVSLQASVLDATGRVVRESQVSATGELDLGKLPAGVYLVRVSHQDLTEVHRVQLQP